MLLGCYIPDCEFRQNPLLLGLTPIQKGGCPAPWGRFGLTPASKTTAPQSRGHSGS